MEPTQPSPTPYSPPITQTPSLSPQPPQQGTWKMPLAILIGVLVLAGGAYALLKNSPDQIAEQAPTPSAVELPLSSPTTSPTADPIADWKTYANAQYEFEFRYPADWPTPTLRTGDNTPYLELGKIMKGACEGSDCSPYLIWIDMSENADEVLQVLRNNELISNIQSTQSAGFRRVTFNEDGICSFGNAHWFTPARTYKLRMRCGDTSDPTFNQLIATFKFIEPTSTVPANWKSFSSKYFTLSFKVPPGFVVTEEQNTIKLFYGEPQQGEYGAPANQSAILTRYNGSYSRSVAIQNFKEVHSKNFYESTIVVDGRTFPLYSGSAMAGEGGCSSQNVLMVPFDLSSFSTCGPSPWNPNMIPDLAKQILSTFKFSK